MISEEVKRGSLNREITYPCLMQVNKGKSGEGSVYLFWAESSAICLLGIHGDLANSVFIEEFDMDAFHMYTGTIQLSNKEYV